MVIVTGRRVKDILGGQAMVISEELKNSYFEDTDFVIHFLFAYSERMNKLIKNQMEKREYNNDLHDKMAISFPMFKGDSNLMLMFFKDETGKKRHMEVSLEAHQDYWSDICKTEDELNKYLSHAEKSALNLHEKIIGYRIRTGRLTGQFMTVHRELNVAVNGRTIYSDTEKQHYIEKDKKIFTDYFEKNTGVGPLHSTDTLVFTLYIPERGIMQYKVGMTFTPQKFYFDMANKFSESPSSNVRMCNLIKDGSNVKSIKKYQNSLLRSGSYSVGESLNVEGDKVEVPTESPKTCRACGDHFAWDSLSDRESICSEVCMESFEVMEEVVSRAYGETVKKSCEFCNKEFEVNKKNLDKQNMEDEYCSMDCMHEGLCGFPNYL